MSYKDKYLARDNAYGSSIGETRKNATIYKINESFKDSPSYHELPIDGVNTEVRVVTTDKYNIQTLLFRPSTVAHFGSYVSIDSEDWIITELFSNDIYPKATIKRCNSMLKWLDADGYLKQYACVFESPSSIQTGIKENQIMTIPNGKRIVTVKKDLITSTLKRDKRFILDNHAYKITDIDSTTKEGLTVLSLEDTEINSADNLELGIADYEGKVANFTVTILNGENFSMKAASTIQLQTEVRNNGVLVSKKLTYQSSNPSVATVSSSGLVSSLLNGKVVITASIDDHPDIQDTTTITVEFENAHNYSIELDSAPVVILNTSKTFTAVIKDNLIINPNRTVYWYLYAADGVGPSDVVQMVMNSTTQCTLKALKIGKAKLKVVLVGSFPTLEQVFDIQVKSLI
nr:Ig-like domain-containing protein [Mycobacterium sp. E3298]